MSDERTKPVFKKAKNASQSTQSNSIDPEETRLVGKDSPPPVSGGETTVLFRKSSPTNTEQTSSRESTPVVGWLVVIEGAGRGNTVTLEYGQNTIGRGGGSKEPRITIDYGDSGISREKQFMVAYDAGSRSFKIVPGDSVNITYLNGEAIYGAQDLHSSDAIKVSATTFRFVAFCDDKFDWDAE